MFIKSKDLFPILNFTNSNQEDKNDYIGVYNELLYKANIKSFSLFDKETFEKSFSKNSNRLKFSSLKIKAINLSEETIKKDIELYYKNIHYINTALEAYIIKEIGSAFKINEETNHSLPIKIVLRSQINFLLNNCFGLKTLDLIDNLQ